MNKDVKDVSEEEILKVYDLIHSQDEIYNDFIKEEVIKIKEEYNRQIQIKSGIEEKGQEDIEK